MQEMVFQHYIQKCLSNHTSALWMLTAHPTFTEDMFKASSAQVTRNQLMIALARGEQGLQKLITNVEQLSKAEDLFHDDFMGLEASLQLIQDWIKRFKES